MSKRTIKKVQPLKERNAHTLLSRVYLPSSSGAEKFSLWAVFSVFGLQLYYSHFLLLPHRPTSYLNVFDETSGMKGRTQGG